jgi:hypothetical protein
VDPVVTEIPATDLAATTDPAATTPATDALPDESVTAAADPAATTSAPTAGGITAP